MEKMEKIDKHFLEQVFGTNPEIEDLQNAKEILEEWIIELNDK